MTLLGGGLYAFPAEEKTSVTALIPAFFGVPLLVLGLVARNASDHVRMHVMHAAALLGLIGFAFPAVRVVMALIGGAGLTRPILAQIAMAALCGVFLALCIRSFVAARIERRKREALGPVD